MSAGATRRVVRSRRFALTAVAVGVLALAHAALTWPPRATLALFGGGAVVAFLGEALVVRLGWLDHHVGPQALGVPVYTLFGWTGTCYAAFRVALLVTDGWPAVVVAAALATGADVLVDHRGVAAGHWTYSVRSPGPRLRGVPVWNYLGWVVVSGLTAALALPVV